MKLLKTTFILKLPAFDINIVENLANGKINKNLCDM
jgi:hypothetical protein